MTRKSLPFEGRTMRPRAVEGSGEVTGETVFTFHQHEQAVWAFYAGGDIRFGCLVGTLADLTLSFRYVQLNRSGETSTGRSIDRIEWLPDGRMRLHEQWKWESKAGEGTSILEED